MKLLIVFVATAACFQLAVGVVCNQAAVEGSQGQCANNPAAIPCPDGTTCQCVSALYNFCGIPTNTDSWIPGANVLSNCGIAPYTAIATFNNGIYDWRNDKGHAGIFLRCVNGGFEMWDQWCENPMNIRFYPNGGWAGDANFVFRTNANNYYVVEW